MGASLHHMDRCAIQPYCRAGQASPARRPACCGSRCFCLPHDHSSPNPLLRHLRYGRRRWAPAACRAVRPLATVAWRTERLASCRRVATMSSSSRRFSPDARRITSSCSTRYVDTTRHHVIIIDALADGHSSSPSNSAVGAVAFAGLTIGDMVEVQHRFLTEHLGLRTRAPSSGFRWVASRCSSGQYGTLVHGCRRADRRDATTNRL